MKPELTKELVLKLAEAIGDGTNWPAHIPRDPIATYYLDLLVQAEPFQCLSQDERGVYEAEAKMGSL